MKSGNHALLANESILAVQTHQYLYYTPAKSDELHTIFRIDRDAYEWAKLEAKANSLPHFVDTICLWHPEDHSHIRLQYERYLEETVKASPKSPLIINFGGRKAYVKKDPDGYVALVTHPTTGRDQWKSKPYLLENTAVEELARNYPTYRDVIFDQYTLHHNPPLVTVEITPTQSVANDVQAVGRVKRFDKSAVSNVLAPTHAQDIVDKILHSANATFKDEGLKFRTPVGFYLIREDSFGSHSLVSGFTPENLCWETDFFASEMEALNWLLEQAPQYHGSIVAQAEQQLLAREIKAKVGHEYAKPVGDIWFSGGGIYCRIAPSRIDEGSFLGFCGPDPESYTNGFEHAAGGFESVQMALKWIVSLYPEQTSSKIKMSFRRLTVTASREDLLAEDTPDLHPGDIVINLNHVTYVIRESGIENSFAILSDTDTRSSVSQVLYPTREEAIDRLCRLHPTWVSYIREQLSAYYRQRKPKQAAQAAIDAAPVVDSNKPTELPQKTPEPTPTAPPKRRLSADIVLRHIDNNEFTIFQVDDAGPSPKYRIKPYRDPGAFGVGQQLAAGTFDSVAEAATVLIRHFPNYSFIIKKQLREYLSSYGDLPDVNEVLKTQDQKRQATPVGPIGKKLTVCGNTYTLEPNGNTFDLVLWKNDMDANVQGGFPTEVEAFFELKALYPGYVTTLNHQYLELMRPQK